MTRLEDEIKAFGWPNFGFARIKKPISIDIYRSWLNQNRHGDMAYLKDHLPLKENPEAFRDKARSAIVITQDYLPHPSPSETKTALNTALYAQGEDYHYWFKGRLQELSTSLENLFSTERFESFTDSSPIMERDLAYKAGLGWFGKNSCLIHQKRGSLFFIGEIYTTMDLSPIEALHPDRCGTCTRCIEACPTQAIIDGRQIDAKKCISYMTIESKELPPESLRSGIHDLFFGCDICQQVCPWNEKAFGKEALKPPVSPIENITQELKFILTTSNKELMRFFAKTPLTRARGFGLKRNAIIISANLKIKILKPEIKNLLVHEKLNELCQWALKELDS